LDQKDSKAHPSIIYIMSTNKTVVSFDIGIKNLAYCIFSIGQEGISVAGWGIVNLALQDAVVKPQCNCAKAKGGALCGKTATYKHGEDQRFCLTHAKSSGKLLPTKELSAAAHKKLKVDELAALCTKYGIGIVSTDKKPDVLAKVVAHFAARTLEPIVVAKSKNANQIHLVEIGKRIKAQFDAVFANCEPTHVILENQISPIAGRMNTIQGMVAQYFIMRDANDRLAIDFISSSGKLKGFSDKVQPTTADKVQPTTADKAQPTTADKAQPTTADKAQDTNTYKDHKRDGIAFCHQFMAANAGLATFRHIIEAAPKKDDLADCFLQGIYYLKRENIIITSENLEINIVK
jgi:hypothetical protein